MSNLSIPASEVETVRVEHRGKEYVVHLKEPPALPQIKQLAAMTAAKKKAEKAGEEWQDPSLDDQIAEHVKACCVTKGGDPLPPDELQQVMNMPGGAFLKVYGVIQEMMGAKTPAKDGEPPAPNP